MSLLDLLRDPLFRSVVMMLWLLPCALQDHRTRHVSNWLTVPLFLAAWPVALFLGNFPLTLATFIGVYAAYRSGAGLGPADGKIAVGLAGVLPAALGMTAALYGLIFVIARMRGERDSHLPGAVGACFSVAGVTLLLIFMQTSLNVGQ